MTDRERSLSTTVKQFFPYDELHVVSIECADAQSAVASESSKPDWSEMAKAVVEDIPVGPFRSTDCQPVIKANWPYHSIASAGGPAFGAEFKNNIWPVLESWGGKIRNPGKKPIQYEMTTEAKNTLG